MGRRYIITNEYEEIESSVIQNNYRVIDDNTGEEIPLRGIVLLSDGHVAGVLNRICCSLRKLVVKDKIAHLTTEPIGGILVKGDIDRFNSECENKIIYNFIF